ncbi:LysR substrate-binding domain-containing protein [Roseomonas sp. OT10]|uniref:LysR substrate-binding domain-containing protein n=1 Tax=Roseomonas cutis TaxID=2897332 RepID=UPI001E46F98D|nr:LysR substrate-binding domain-containing protein [Roseomonas sp. OT10]UFN48636.1 LysR substrate-binding domain-containing protein [Roseomonas sp. OT10]
MRRLPPLSALRAFEAVARLGSVTRAAEELGRTHGAVSRQLRTLQEAAGIDLFEKAGTGLRPNAAGQALRDVAATAFGGLEQGWGRLLDEARSPAIHVACSASFAMRWLVPRLGDFQKQQPGTRLRLSMTTARELRHEGADLVIAWNRASYPRTEQAQAIPLGGIAFGPVWSPAYPVTVTPGRLEFRDRIAHEHLGAAWELWQARSGTEVQAGATLAFPHTHLCIEAAIAGIGVALVERRLVRDDLAQGRLLAPCGFTPFPEGIAAVPTSEKARSPAARGFLAWLSGTLRDTAG